MDNTHRPLVWEQVRLLVLVELAPMSLVRLGGTVHFPNSCAFSTSMTNDVMILNSHHKTAELDLCFEIVSEASNWLL